MMDKQTRRISQHSVARLLTSGGTVMRGAHWIGMLVMALGTVGQVWAIPAEGLRQAEASQQQLKSRTQSITEQIDTTIAEFERNGLANGEEVRTLKGIRSVLGQLSDKQMQQVIDLLQKARTTPNAAQATSDAEQAHSGQQGILSQLNQLLKDYRRQQSFLDLARRIDALAARQDTNLSGAVDVAKVTFGKTFQQFDPSQTAAVNVQHGEQEQLKTDISEVVQEIRTAAGQNEGDQKERLAKALSTAERAKVLELASAAANDLAGGNLYRAATNEKIVRDGLREMARLVAPPETATERLRRAGQEIDQAIDQQKKLAEQTKPLPAKRPETTEMERQQAKVVDQADATKRAIADLAPKAAQELDKALDKMQEARAKLNQTDPKSAAAKQDEAVAALEKAKAELNDQIAKAEKAPDQPKDKLAATKELRDQTRDLQKKQDEVAKQPATQPAEKNKQQADLADKARQVQQAAAEVAPDAAKDLGDAAKDMDRAKQAMEQKQPAQAPQDAAKQELAAAEKKLDEQVKNLEKAEAQLDKAQDLQQKLGEMIQKQQDLERDTAKAAAAEAQKQPTPKAPEALAKDQKQLQKDAQAAQDEMKQRAPAESAPKPAEDKAAKAQAQAQAQAQEAMQSAKKSMENAQEQLQKDKPAEARPEQQQAVKDLQQAKAQVDQQVENLQQQLGKPDEGAPLDKIAEQLQKAQDQIDQAQTELAKGQDNAQATQKAADALTEAAKSAAKASAEDQGKLADAAKNSLNKAQDALSDAAAQSQAKQTGEAMKNSEKAKQAIAQAQAAVQMQQAGQPGPPAQMPGQAEKPDQPGEPGKTLTSDKADAGHDGVNPNGARGDKAAGASFVSLPARDRAAILQSQAEKYPQEYAPQVEQYLRNLSDQGK